MKKSLVAMFLATFLAGAAAGQSQDGKKTEEPPERAASTTEHGRPAADSVLLRVQVVFTEYQGEKKVSSLPYTLLVNTGDKPRAALRMGLRVPVVTGEANGKLPQTFQYVDVGTNLDGLAEKEEHGAFHVELNVEKSSSYNPENGDKQMTVGGSVVGGGTPVIQQFRGHFNLLIKDGETLQACASTDPVTGNMLKMDVTLNVVK